MLFISPQTHLVKTDGVSSSPSRSSKQRDEHDHAHKLCEEDEWSEEGPHWPQCNVKAARDRQKHLERCTTSDGTSDLRCHVVTVTAEENCGRFQGAEEVFDGEFWFVRIQIRKSLRGCENR